MSRELLFCVVVCNGAGSGCSDSDTGRTAQLVGRPLGGAAPMAAAPILSLTDAAAEAQATDADQEINWDQRYETVGDLYIISCSLAQTRRV